MDFGSLNWSEGDTEPAAVAVVVRVVVETIRRTAAVRAAVPAAAAHHAERACSRTFRICYC